MEIINVTAAIIEKDGKFLIGKRKKELIWRINGSFLEEK